MINVSVRVTHAPAGGSARTDDFWLGGESLDGVLAEDIGGMLEGSRRPKDEGDELRLELLGAWHVSFGLRTFPVRPRPIRRAAERLWPIDGPAPDVARKAAFLLLVHKSCVIRLSPFAGLVATRA